MEIGITELRRMSILINWIGTYLISVFWRRMNAVVRNTKITNSILERLFIYISRIPNLVLAVDPPIDILVSLPT